MLSLAKILFDGAILSALASAVILISLRVNPRIFLQDYPRDIQERVPPKTPAERRLSLLIGIPFLLLLLAVPAFSSWTLKHSSSTPVTFWTLFLNASGVAFVFNLVDLLLLDWGIMCMLTPRFLVVPGSEGAAGYKDYRYHFRGFLVGSVLSVAAGLVIATAVFFS
ncbi:MAG: nitroreductase [Pseudomonadota bacterium]